MLNPFPIQFLALFAYFLLRVSVGSMLIFLGVRHYTVRNELRHILRLSWFPYGVLATTLFFLGEILIGGLLIVGAYTQYAALALILMSTKLIILGAWFQHPSIPGRLFYILLCTAALSLFITGAGVFAFDLPI